MTNLQKYLEKHGIHALNVSKASLASEEDETKEEIYQAALLNDMMIGQRFIKGVLDGGEWVFMTPEEWALEHGQDED